MGFKVFYLGEFYQAKNLPWHYLFVSIFATTPLLIIFSSTGGLLLNFKRISNIILKLMNKSKLRYMEKSRKAYCFYCFFNIYTIISFFILNSIIYNNKCHFYFIYPFNYSFCLFYQLHNY